MSDGTTKTPVRPDADTAASGGIIDEGWYLYGITARLASPDRGRLQADRSLHGGAFPGGDVEFLEIGRLCAVVRRVPLDGLESGSLEGHSGNIATLEELVRGHNMVIDVVGKEGPILPAKFGSVYARQEDLREALEGVQEVLISRLEYVEGCDEWALHVYADRACIGESAAIVHPGVQRLRLDIQSASPGRAYFLRQKLADELEAAAKQASAELAEEVYDDLAALCVDVQPSPRSAPGGEEAGEVELLRAACLVRRGDAEGFISRLGSLVESYDGLRCEYSGPWPPYSFAAIEEGLG